MMEVTLTALLQAVQDGRRDDAYDTLQALRAAGDASVAGVRFDDSDADEADPESLLAQIGELRADRAAYVAEGGDADHWNECTEGGDVLEALLKTAEETGVAVPDETATATAGIPGRTEGLRP